MHLSQPTWYRNMRLTKQQATFVQAVIERLRHLRSTHGGFHHTSLDPTELRLCKFAARQDGDLSLACAQAIYAAETQRAHLFFELNGTCDSASARFLQMQGTLRYIRANQ